METTTATGVGKRTEMRTGKIDTRMETTTATGVGKGTEIVVTKGRKDKGRKDQHRDRDCRDRNRDREREKNFGQYVNYRTQMAKREKDKDWEDGRDRDREQDRDRGSKHSSRRESIDTRDAKPISSPRGHDMKVTMRSGGHVWSQNMFDQSMEFM
ncbi:hypothetical protein FANTH_12209 [Fusarium anthophilum]|uniref:Uncharacterized protein n=1 Tax=Fusarium anthophilum TaxID=48485 RepID=A0A8H4YTV2_9HYPO|nr:hypothetical protein FANTH_12209 [Fusarium anthophilum]